MKTPQQLPARLEPLRPLINAVVRNVPGRRVRWGSLRRTEPFSACYGWDRGEPIDRHYIQGFLARNAQLIRGEVLEVRRPTYAPLGGAAVTGTHVVDIDATNPQATLVADLTVEDSLPAAAFDAIVMTQTLHFLERDEAGFRTLWRALRPGGAILFSGPCISRLDNESPEADRHRYTPAGLRAQLARVLPGAEVHVESHGNVLAGAAFLFGLAAQELSGAELDARDERFPIVVCATIAKPRESD